jgi:hypothetical protein
MENLEAVSMAEQYPLTKHAKQQMDARRVRVEALAATLSFGRKVHIRGAIIYAIGKRESRKWGRQGIDLSPFEGVQAVCSPDGAIMTVYRNRELRRLRPHRRRWGFRHRAKAFRTLFD